MADAEKKKSKITEAVEALSTIDSLNAAMVVAGAYIDEGTVVQFGYTFDEEGENPKVYDYVALWVADAWYITGVSDSISRRQSNEQFAKTLANKRTVRAVVMVAGDSIK